MPSPDQDSSLRALVAGERPEEVIFDPITDNDSTGSCLGCAYSVLAGATGLVALYAGANRYGWLLAERFFLWAGPLGLLATFLLLALAVFAIIEVFSAKEIYVLLPVQQRLELRQRRGRAPRVVREWSLAQVRRFVLDEQTEPDPTARSGLYVVLDGEPEPLRLLEACYERSFVEQIERALADACQVLSTTSSER
jgi:hypothetical protein